MMGNYGFTQPVVPITAGSDGLGGNNSFVWILALLLIGGGGFGGVGNRGALPEVTGYQLGELSGKVATSDSIQTLQTSTNQGFAGLNTAIMTSTTQLSNGICSLGFDLTNRINDVARIVESCCCRVIEAVGQVRYDLANFASAITKNDDSNTQKVLDAICGLSKQISAQETQALRDRVNFLETKALVAGGCNSY